VHQSLPVHTEPPSAAVRVHQSLPVHTEPPSAAVRVHQSLPPHTGTPSAVVRVHQSPPPHTGTPSAGVAINIRHFCRQNLHNFSYFSSTDTPLRYPRGTFITYPCETFFTRIILPYFAEKDYELLE